MDKYIETPLTKEKVKELHAGDYVYILQARYIQRVMLPINGWWNKKSREWNFLL